MIPQPRVADARGRLCWLDELLGDGVNPRTALTAEEQAAWDALGARHLCVLSPEQQGHGSDDVVDLDGTLLAWMRRYGSKVLAVRPDRFVAAADRSGMALPEAGTP
jgi:3-(3-hydroxy-phenyl)propionate hydroxylase